MMILADPQVRLRFSFQSLLQQHTVKTLPHFVSFHAISLRRVILVQSPV
jgi:hypothetical protein